MFRPLAAVLGVAVATLLGSGCRSAPGEDPSGGSDPAAPLSAADLAAIRATDSAFASAAAAGDAAALAGMYLPDAHLLPPNAPAVQGREAVRKHWGGLTDAYHVRMDVAADAIEGRGDLAYAHGRYSLDATPKGKEGAPLHDAGKYLEILRRQSDGSWRYAVDMYSSDLPVPK